MIYKHTLDISEDIIGVCLLDNNVEIVVTLKILNSIKCFLFVWNIALEPKCTTDSDIERQNQRIISTTSNSYGTIVKSSTGFKIGTGKLPCKDLSIEDLGPAHQVLHFSDTFISSWLKIIKELKLKCNSVQVA